MCGASGIGATSFLELKQITCMFLYYVIEKTFSMTTVLPSIGKIRTVSGADS